MSIQEADRPIRAGDLDRAQRFENEVPTEGANHHHIAVGEIDHKQDAVHQGVTDRDECVDAAQNQPSDGKAYPGVGAEYRCAQDSGEAPEDETSDEDGQSHLSDPVGVDREACTGGRDGVHGGGIPMSFWLPRRAGPPLSAAPLAEEKRYLLLGGFNPLAALDDVEGWAGTRALADRTAGHRTRKALVALDPAHSGDERAARNVELTIGAEDADVLDDFDQHRG